MSLTTINDSNIFKKGVIGNVRKAQEDSHDMAAMTPNGDVFVVCDGMGGHVGGAQASSIAVASILEHLKKERYANPIVALDGALQFANMQILGYAAEHPELQGMGTTACILLLQGNDAWIAHVGDSRIYLFLGKEKQLHRITKDHSYVQTLVDQHQISDAEAERHPMKNRIMKALGIKPELQPTFNYMERPIHPKNGDIFLICSDGLSGMIPDSTIERVLASKMPIDLKGEKLISLAMQGETVVPGGQDNCTLELIKIDSSPWKTTDFKSFNPEERQYKSKGSSFWTSPLFFTAAAALLILIVVLIILPKRPDPKPETSDDNTAANVDIKELYKKYVNDSIMVRDFKRLDARYQDTLKMWEQRVKEADSLKRKKIELKDNTQTEEINKKIKEANEGKAAMQKKIDENREAIANAEKGLNDRRKEYLDAKKKADNKKKEPTEKSKANEKEGSGLLNKLTGGGDDAKGATTAGKEGNPTVKAATGTDSSKMTPAKKTQPKSGNKTPKTDGKKKK